MRSVQVGLFSDITLGLFSDITFLFFFVLFVFCVASCIVVALVARLCFLLPSVRRGDPGDHLQVEPTPIPRATVRGRVLVAEAGPRAWSDLLDLRNRRPMARTVQEVNSSVYFIHVVVLFLGTASGYCF